MSENREWQAGDRAWSDFAVWRRGRVGKGGADPWWMADTQDEVRTDAKMTSTGAMLIATADGPVDHRADRAAFDRARDTAALLESELAGAVVPQVLTAETPEPPRPWRVVPTWDVDQDWTSEGAAHVQTWAQAVSTAASRPVFVISARAGDDRG